MANVRIKDLTTDSALAAGDYVVIDSASEGSRKFDLGTEISGLKDESDKLVAASYVGTDKSASATSNNYRLNEDNGNCHSDSSYKIVKYTVTAGDFIKVVSDDRFQFQSTATVPTTGSNTRIGTTYGTGTFYLYAPENATYVIVSTLKTGSTAKVQTLEDASAVVESMELLNRQKNGFVYTTGTARHSWTTTGSNGGIYFTVGATKMYCRIPDITYELTIADIASDISGSYTVNSNSVTFTLDKFSKVLVYNLTDKLLHIRNYATESYIRDDDIILVANAYGIPVCGWFYDEFINRNVEDDISNGMLSAADIFNAEPYTGSYDWQTPAASYGALFNGLDNVESFAFFTDPHIMGFADNSRNDANLANYMKQVQKVYNATPCGFIVCGGDWLNNGTTKNEACYRLGYAKGIAKRLLDGCYLVMGNHDTNYQGKDTASSAANTGRLDDDNIAAILYRDTNTKKAYYSFDGDIAKCYVLDTGTEHSNMTDYDWEQVAWLANALATDDPTHAIIFIHTIVDGNAVQTNASNFGTLVQAYNEHTTVTLNSVAYDFTGCSGHVDFWIAGHTHADSNGTLGGIPYVITASNATSSYVPLIDLALVDYDAGKLYLVRAGGTGSDRTINLT